MTERKFSHTISNNRLLTDHKCMGKTSKYKEQEVRVPTFCYMWGSFFSMKLFLHFTKSMKWIHLLEEKHSCACLSDKVMKLLVLTVL